ncbi:MAG: UDP-N-acetylmuramate--L-alanine ligase [Patescibacteria group bacterium]
MKTPIPQNKQSAHLIGIGGIGISALARYFLSKNWAVSGSDIAPSDLIHDLKREGAMVKIGHKKGNLAPKTGLVVYNQAIPAHNPELKEARRLRIPTLTYPEALGWITREYKTITVSGAHGKSTTTALLSIVLMRAGFDPTVIVGTKLPHLNGKNFRLGKSSCFLLEADEWRASFLNYSPTYAVITNIDAEHLDFYKNFSNVKKTFLKFFGNIKSGGILVANKDDKNLFGLKSQIQKIAKRNNFRVVWYGGMMHHTTRRRIKRVLKVPGIHNVSNALAAYTLAKALGIRDNIIFKALGAYRGAWRRMEFRGRMIFSIKNKVSSIRNTKYSIPVFDDYAHHPTEIKATLQAFREKFPKKKIICVFQPHQAHRLKNLFEDFVNAFDLADHLILLPIYEVAGRDKPHRGYTSADLAKAIKKQETRNKKQDTVTYLPSPNRLRRFLIENCKLKIENCVIVMMGAGDIVNYTKSLLKK